MKKFTFRILSFIEFLFFWVVSDIFVGRGWLNALLLIGGNILFAKRCYQKFLKWFEPLEVDESAVQNAALAITAVEIILFQFLNIGLHYAM